MTLSPGQTAEAGGIRFRRKCPGCGALIRYSEGDRALACSYCGLHLALVTGSPMPRYAVPLQGTSAEWVAQGRAALDAFAGARLASSAPCVIFVPFHRLRADTWHCWKSRAPARAVQESQYLPWAPQTAEGAFDFRVGSWEYSMTGCPSLAGIERTLGLRLQVLELVPWQEWIEALEPGAIAETGVCFRVLPPETAPQTACAALLRQLAEASALPPEEVEGQSLYTPFPEFQQVYAPFVLLPVGGSAAAGAVLLDGWNGHLHAVLTPEEAGRLRAALGPEPEIPRLEENAPPDSPVVALACPECSSPLPWIARARVHRCEICGRSWLARQAGLIKVEATCLRAPGPARSPLLHLPFYRIRAGDGSSFYLPAFRGRHTRSVWRLAVALSRKQAAARMPDFEETDAPPSAAAPVEMEPDQATRLLPFLLTCMRERLPEMVPPPCDAGRLLWLPFERKGPDLCSLLVGLSLPAAALAPWEPETVTPALPGRKPLRPSLPARADA